MKAVEKTTTLKSVEFNVISNIIPILIDSLRKDNNLLVLQDFHEIFRLLSISETTKLFLRREPFQWKSHAKVWHFYRWKFDQEKEEEEESFIVCCKTWRDLRFSMLGHQRLSSWHQSRVALLCLFIKASHNEFQSTLDHALIGHYLFSSLRVINYRTNKVTANCQLIFLLLMR